MKKYFILCLLSINVFAETTSLYPMAEFQTQSNGPTTPPMIYGGMGIGAYPGGSGFGAGMNGGAFGGVNGNGFTPNQPSSNLGFYDKNSSNQYRAVRPSADCPLLTKSAKDDQDLFSDLNNYFSSFSQKNECAMNNMSSKMAIGQLESMLNANNDQGMKCYSKNIKQISDRNMALFYVNKGIDMSISSPYYSCTQQPGLSTLPSKENLVSCINNKYQEIVELNAVSCKEAVAPALVQEQINKGLIELERVLSQAISQSNSCAPAPKDAFKVTINTFLKAKSFSVLGPWGSVAGFGADLIGNLIDKFFPNDAQRASALLTDILNEDNYEQNACLYFNIQQKLYCNEAPLKVDVPSGSCNRIDVQSDLAKLMNNVRELKNVADSSLDLNRFPIMTNGAPLNIDTTKIENRIDDLIRYSKASEIDIRDRIKKLPKVQQAKEMDKINKMFAFMEQYQNFDPSKPGSYEIGQKALEGLVPLLIGDTQQRINFDELVLKTTPGVKFEALKQSGIASAIESLMANSENRPSENGERSRAMAKYNKYKNAMGDLAQTQFKVRLEKQFEEFKNRAKFVSNKDNGVVEDSVSEGILRNIVRHCTLMQEIYDPKLEGTLPTECEKLNCGSENRFNWFKPKSNQKNLNEFKKSFCEKNISYIKIEENFIKELKNPNGAMICGKKISDLF